MRLERVAWQLLCFDLLVVEREVARRQTTGICPAISRTTQYTLLWVSPVGGFVLLIMHKRPVASSSASLSARLRAETLRSSTSGGVPDFIHIPALLTSSEVAKFERFAHSSLSCIPAEHYKKGGDRFSEPRRSSIAWMAPTTDQLDGFSDDDIACPRWLYHKLIAAMQTGARAWPTLLPGFQQRAVIYEHIQYAR